MVYKWPSIKSESFFWSFLWLFVRRLEWYKMEVLNATWVPWFSRGMPKGDLETILGNLPSKSVCEDKNQWRFNICNCQLPRVTDWHPINKHAPVTWGRLRLQMTRENVETELEPYAIPGYIMLYPCPGATDNQCFGNLQQRLLLSVLGLPSLENKVMAIWQHCPWANTIYSRKTKRFMYTMWDRNRSEPFQTVPGTLQQWPKHHETQFCSIVGM